MDNMEMQAIVDKLFGEIEKLVPHYMERVEEKNISMDNLALCIIDESGIIYWKFFGTDKPGLRRSYRMALTKASQARLTGVKTGDYERTIFNIEIDENASGIEAPDIIGWQGGQLIVLKNGKKLSVGLSGFRGVTDLEIIIKAVSSAEQSWSSYLC